MQPCTERCRLNQLEVSGLSVEVRRNDAKRSDANGSWSEHPDGPVVASRGRGDHDVHTAVVLRRGPVERSEVVTTRVWFQPLDEAEISWYVDSGEPEGKAGAYAIQGRAARFIQRIDGSWSNVVGLPIATVYQLLHELE